MHHSWTEALHRLRQPLVDRGLPSADADLVAEITARTIGMGIPTHGLPCWRGTVQQIGAAIRVDAIPVFTSEQPAVAELDARALAPQVALWRALHAGFERASRYGIARIGVHHAGWVGALGPYLVEALRVGFPTFITGQSSGCADCAPIGGLDPLFSTNPIGMCYGGLEDGMIADFSTAAVAMGRVRGMQRTGQRAPEAWFRERDGVWTDDPQAMQRGGSLAFSGGRHGGHRGFALSLWTEAMAVLGGGHAHDGSRPGSQNLLITVHAPGPAATKQMTAEVQRLHALVRANRREDPAQPIRLPGARALAALAEAQSNGLDLDEPLLPAG